MKQIFKTEMKRAMRGNGMALSILIGILIGTAHVIQEIIPAYRANLTNFEKGRMKKLSFFHTPYLVLVYELCNK